MFIHSVIVTACHNYTQNHIVLVTNYSRIILFSLVSKVHSNQYCYLAYMYTQNHTVYLLHVVTTQKIKLFALVSVISTQRICLLPAVNVHKLILVSVGFNRPQLLYINLII